jgi:hypothetical protein
MRFAGFWRAERQADLSGFPQSASGVGGPGFHGRIQADMQGIRSHFFDHGTAWEKTTCHTSFIFDSYK